MRHAFSAAFAAALGLFVAIPMAAAQQPAVREITFSPELQTELAEDYGAREAPVLQRAVEQALASQIEQRAGLTIDVVIVDAAPNRPTMEQLGQRVGLSMQSISVGGAEIKALIRGTDGQVVAEVDHRFYDRSFADLTGAESTWSSARRAIRQWARKVADAYEANA
jgi:AICAR transformylase/IMP cyclohydrolase PurH